MRLRDRIQPNSNSRKNEAAIPATTAIQETEWSSNRSSIARIAEIASEQSVNSNPSSIRKRTREELLRLLPPIIEGCRLSDILDKADPQNDFDENGLLNGEILTNFARYLYTTGEIKPIGELNEYYRKRS